MDMYANKKRIKNYLIIINILLGGVTLALLIFGVFVVQPQQVATATKLQQYIFFDLKKLAASNVAVLNPSTEQKTTEHKEANIDDGHKFILRTQHPRIAIIITNLGLNRLLTELALTMPPQIALGFLPYTTSLKPLLYKAREDGHEIYLNIPFETDRYNNHGLNTNFTNDENIKKLKNILATCSGYHGVYIKNQENFINNHNFIDLILDELIVRKLIFIVSKDVNTVLPKYILGKKQIIPTSIIIDQEAEDEEIKKKLDLLIEQAKTDNTAIAYVHGYAITLDIIKNWLPTLKQHHIELVPVSELFKESDL
jgi:polysaccharide deacetylase 2 family uncharacterized protein YibQ